MTRVRNWSGVTPNGQHPVRHGLGFVVSGGLAFATDAAILALLMHFGLHPIAARFFAISLAMVIGWLAHRRLTFGLTTAPHFAEFVRYAAVAWTVAAINYGAFVLLVLLWPSMPPFYALVVSSAVAMVFSYLGMRFAAFRKLGG